MGACDFSSIGKGKTAQEAFSDARSEAQWEHGHGGYTGTIAEKYDFVVIDVPEGYTPTQYASKLMEDDDERISDKWGPAGCVKLGEDRWLFFGYASS